MPESSGRSESDPGKAAVGSELSSTQLSLVAFALSEAGRTLSHQQAELDRLRERALNQLAYSTAIATFILGSILGTDPTRNGRFYFLIAGATAIAAVALAATSQVWRPVQEWRFKIAASHIVDSYANSPSLEAMSELAHFYDAAREKNEQHLTIKRRQFRYATSASAALLAWLILSFWQLA